MAFTVSGNCFWRLFKQLNRQPLAGQKDFLTHACNILSRMHLNWNDEEKRTTFFGNGTKKIKDVACAMHLKCLQMTNKILMLLKLPTTFFFIKKATLWALLYISGSRLHVLVKNKYQVNYISGKGLKDR